MKTYLAMINEEKLKKVVASADKSDFVFIFYFSGNDNSGGIKPVVRKAKAKAEDVTKAVSAKVEPVKKL